MGCGAPRLRTRCRVPPPGRCGNGRRAAGRRGRRRASALIGHLELAAEPQYRRADPRLPRAEGDVLEFADLARRAAEVRREQECTPLLRRQHLEGLAEAFALLDRRSAVRRRRGAVGVQARRESSGSRGSARLSLATSIAAFRAIVSSHVSTVPRRGSYVSARRQARTNASWATSSAEPGSRRIVTASP